MGDLPYLSLLTFVPAVAALVLAFVPNDRMVKIGAFVTSLVVLVLAFGMLGAFVPEAAPKLSLVEDHMWIRQLNIHYRMGVDGIAVTMIVLTALLMPLAIGSTLLTVRWLKRIDGARFYVLIYLLMVVLGAKLMWDGLAG